MSSLFWLAICLNTSSNFTGEAAAAIGLAQSLSCEPCLRCYRTQDRLLPPSLLSARRGWCLVAMTEGQLGVITVGCREPAAELTIQISR